MPYKSEKILLSETQDRRRKLTEAEKDEIKHRYKIGDGSQRTLAKEFGVSRSCIQNIVNPEIAARRAQRVKEHWRDYRPSKEEWAKIQREHHHYKQKLYLSGELADKNK